jgi:3-hydroxyacyl-[acyl-carrier-protein] dehydratase
LAFLQENRIGMDPGLSPGRRAESGCAGSLGYPSAIAIDHMVVMQFSIPSDHPSLPGHFPGHPVVPGVVVLERVLDAIEAAHGPLGALRLPQVKFVQPLLPGERARVVLDGTAPRWRFQVLRDEVLLASGEVLGVDTLPTRVVGA